MSNPTVKRSEPKTLKQLQEMTTSEPREAKPEDVAREWAGPLAQVPKGRVPDIVAFLNSRVTSPVKVSYVNSEVAVLKSSTPAVLKDLFKEMGFVPPHVFHHKVLYAVGSRPRSLHSLVDRQYAGTAVGDLIHAADQKWVFTSGNVQSLLQRLVSKVGRGAVDGARASRATETVVEWVSSLGVAIQLTSDLEDYLDSYLYKNLKAGDGLPFQTGHNSFGTAKQDWTMCAAAASGKMALLILSRYSTATKLKEFLRDNNWLATVEINSKQEAYKRAQVWQGAGWDGLANANVKARAVFTWPGWTVPAAGGIVDAFCEKVPKFYDNPASPFAIGFSWCRGGAAKLVHCFTSLEIGDERIVVYGDDIIYGRRLSESVVRMVSLDVEAMDLSMRRVHADAWLKVLQASVSSAPPQVLEFMALYCPLMVTAPILLGGLVLQSSSGLRSGAVGTTWLDSVASMMVYSDYLRRKETQPDLVFESAAPASAEAMGLRIKEGTLVHDYRDGDNTLGVPFLGVDVVKVVTPHGSGWIPQRKDADTAKSLVAPKVVSKEERAPSVELGRLISLYAWGSWARPESDELKGLIRAYADMYRTAGATMLDQSTWLRLPDVPGFPQDAWFAELIWGDDLPPVGGEHSDEFFSAEEPDDKGGPSTTLSSWADEMDFSEATGRQSVGLKPKYEASQATVVREKSAKKADLAIPRKAKKAPPSWKSRVGLRK